MRCGVPLRWPLLVCSACVGVRALACVCAWLVRVRGYVRVSSVYACVLSGARVCVRLIGVRVVVCARGVPERVPWLVRVTMVCASVRVP